MISLDTYVIEFIGQNWVTITLALMLLKGLAQMSTWTWDETLVKIFVGMFNTVKPDKQVKNPDPQ